ncbi:MAG: hypothetical protein CL908_14725 [Deltaproteobacteria bacterium]|nr:hypothetical protein [Deltaproteobacteria bacterium]
MTIRLRLVALLLVASWLGQTVAPHSHVHVEAEAHAAAACRAELPIHSCAVAASSGAAAEQERLSAQEACLLCRPLRAPARALALLPGDPTSIVGPSAIVVPAAAAPQFARSALTQAHPVRGPPRSLGS